MKTIFYIVLIAIVSAPVLGFGKYVQFRYLEYLDGTKVTLQYSNATQSILTSASVYKNVAKFTVPKGEWNFKLLLPFHEPLRYKNKKVIQSDTVDLVISTFNHATIGGSISKKLNQGIYVVDTDLLIPAGVQLEILPGTIFKLEEGVTITVEGQLDAYGTGTNPVKFIAFDTAKVWGGISINSEYPSSFSQAEISRVSSPAFAVEHSAVTLSGVEITSVFPSSGNTNFAIQAYNRSSLEMKNSFFGNSNVSSLIEAVDSEIAVEGMLVSNCKHNDGGLISLRNADLSISYTTIFGNAATNNSPIIHAVSNASHAITVSNSIFAMNVAEMSPAMFDINGGYVVSLAKNCFHENVSYPDSSVASNYKIESMPVLQPPVSNNDSEGNVWCTPSFADPYKQDFSLLPDSELLDAIAQLKKDFFDVDYMGSEAFSVIDVLAVQDDPGIISDQTAQCIYIDLGSVEKNVYLNDDLYSSRFVVYNSEDVLAIETVQLYGDDDSRVNTPDLDPGPVDLSICAGEKLFLGQAEASDYTELTWVTDGDGTFDDEHILHPLYTPGANDIRTGETKLRVTAINRSVDHYNESQWLLLSIDPTFRPFGKKVHESCSTEPIKLVSERGDRYRWNDGTIQQYIYATPGEPTDYSVTVTRGACVVSGTITLAKKEPYRDTLSFLQDADVVLFDVPGVESESAQFNWVFDNNFATAREKNARVQFLKEGVHTACVTITDTVEKCASSFCKDFEYNLPKYEIGGQLFCKRKPVNAAYAELFRSVNGNWVMIDSVPTSDNGYFYKKMAPLGHYKVRASLLKSDPNYGNYCSTYYGGTSTQSKATVIDHYANSWKIDIELALGTTVPLGVSRRASVFPTVAANIIAIESGYAIERCNIVAQSGVEYACTKREAEEKSIDISRFSPGLYAIFLIFSDGRKETHQFIKK